MEIISDFAAVKMGRISEKGLNRLFGSSTTHLWVGYLTRLKLILGIDTPDLEVVNFQNFRALKVCYKKNNFGPFPGSNWSVPFQKKSDYARLSYEVYIPEDFDFVKGGKLPGLAGGRANMGGDKPAGNDGWSVRFMFKEEGAICAYLYYVDMPDRFGEKKFLKVNGILSKFIKGSWNRIELEVRMNQPGLTDGFIRCGLNGATGLECDDIRFRLSERLGADQMLFSTFFGGGDASWAPSRDAWLLFGNFKLEYQ
jgi:hypothetical protein